MRQTGSFISALALAALLAGCETFVPATLPADQVLANATETTDDENVIVLVASEQAANSLLVNAARRGYQLREQMRLSGLDMILLDFERPEGVSGPLAISDMQQMEPSATAGLDHRYTLQNDISSIAAQPRLYAQTMLAWPEAGCRALTRIGMIDGALDQTAPDISGAEIVVRDFSNGSPGAIDHGTAIADLLVGPGRLANARLYSASVVSSTNNQQAAAGVSEMIEALDWMQASDVPLVNISLAGPYNRLLDRAVQRATSKGMIIIAAVGNDGPEAPPRYPAAFKNVIAVTAVDSAREIYAQAVRGEHVDFSAPGVDVYVGSNGVGQYLSGTSVAAPFVTALIASDARLSQARNTKQVRDQLSISSVDLGSAGKDPVFGAGLIRISEDCSNPR